MEEKKKLKERINIAAKNLNDKGLFFPKNDKLVTLADHEIAVPLFIELFGIAPQYEVIGSSIYLLGDKVNKLSNKIGKTENDSEGEEDNLLKRILTCQFANTTYWDYCHEEQSYHNPNNIKIEKTQKIVNILTEVLHQDEDDYIHFANEVPSERYILEGGVMIDFVYKGKDSSEVLVYVFAEDREQAKTIIKNFGYLF